MGVKTYHDDYTLLKKTWSKCIDFTESETAVKSKGEEYLPRLTEQDDDEYISYKGRTAVIMLAQKALKSMVGMITRKDSYIQDAKQVEGLIEEIDSEGNSIHTYISKLLTRYFKTGRSLTLIDVPRVDSPMTVKQAEDAGIRPRWIYYNEQDIINWKVDRINNVDVLTMVVLREAIDVPTEGDEFNWTSSYNYRVLDLVKGTYRQRLFDENEQQIGTDIFPKMNGQFLKYIPAVFHGGIEAQTPPLDQIIDINLHHYQLSADEIHGLRMTALPTPYFFGEDPEAENFPTHIGPTRMIGSDNENAKIGFLEFTGAGLAKVADKLKSFEDLIAALSVQLLTENVNQSATGANIDYASATSSVAGIVAFLSEELTIALKILAEWGNKKYEDVEIKLNKDFMPASMTPQMLLALLQALRERTISYETFYRNLAQGEITDPHKEPSEELSDIEKEIPPGLNGMTDIEDENTGGAQNNNQNADGEEDEQ